MQRSLNRQRRFPSIERFEDRCLLVANPIITEFVASNFKTLTDASNEPTDWIEIYNDGDTDVDLANGYYLTDDPQNLTKWRFPNVPSEQ